MTWITRKLRKTSILKEAHKVERRFFLTDYISVVWWLTWCFDTEVVQVTYCRSKLDLADVSLSQNNSFDEIYIYRKQYVSPGKQTNNGVQAGSTL